jgi:16S rRNA (guanine966-N2)-methyltransferase
VRIIGGTHAGIRLSPPKGSGVRPTLDRVREAIFNRLAAEIKDSNVLDLFSGTGAIAVEALSRGAKNVYSVELSPRQLKTIQSNQRLCKFSNQQHTIRLGDVFTIIKDLANSHTTFDLIFADPPFGPKTTNTRSKSLTQKLLDDPNLPLLTTPETTLVVGHATRDQIELPPHWRLIKGQKYGDASINYLAQSTLSPKPQN